MASNIRLIVGLGNPGPQYADTRHNAGCWFVEELADRYSASWRAEARFKSRVSQIIVNSQKIWLLVPQTFMNHSGDAIGSFARYHDIAAEQILVAHDELDLLPGRVKLKQGGGAAGHNGLRDTTQKLGSPDYLRLRLGIGHPGKQSIVVSFVLKRPTEAEMSLIRSATEHAADYIGDIIQGDIQTAMNALHSHS